MSNDLVDPNGRRNEKILRHYGMSAWHSRMLNRKFCTLCVAAFRADLESLHENCDPNGHCECRHPSHKREPVTTGMIKTIREQPKEQVNPSGPAA